MTKHAGSQGTASRGRGKTTAAALGLTLALALAASPNARAAGTTTGFALDRFDPAERGSMFFTQDTLDLRGDIRPAVGLVLDYAYKPLVAYDKDGKEVKDLVKNQLYFHLGGGVTLFDRFRIMANLPIALLNSGENVAVGGSTLTAPTGVAVGDLRLGGDVRILGTYGDPLTLAAGLQVFIPTGSTAQYAGDGNVRITPHVAVAGQVADVFTYAARAAFQYRGASGDASSIPLGSEVQFGVAAGALLLDKALTIGPELTVATTFTNDAAGKSLAFSDHGTPLELIIGAHYQLDDFQFGAGVGPGLTQAYGTPTLRGLASFTWTPAIKVIKDRDGDTILDDVDACPDVPGVTSMDPAKNGCPLPPPPPDRDHDGILDAQDACPDVPGIAQPDPKMNGCPGKDSDGDGIWDFEDACPTRKGPKTSDPKTNGCPPDRDGDGIPDSVDACPDEKGVPSDDLRINGCPPPKDTDGDGITDNIDACPTEKGIPELKGCPDKDTDGDGVVDRFDNCPTEKGPKENSGCPLKQKQFVVITKEKLEIKDKVFFDTNKATIQKKSFPLLEQIAHVIVAHPEITRVVVEGHTDNVGKPDTNQKLSEDRAASVKAFLASHGVDTKRIDSKGYGQDKPIDTNKTATGRANNRRVEFTLPPVDAN